MSKTADVLIIGAGVIGCSIAYHLAKMGCHDVIVLEKNYIGSGATERCAGGIRHQFSTAVNIRLSMESVKFFERLEDETGHPADFRQYGYLMLATKVEEVRQFRDNVSLQQKLGVPVNLISPHDVKEMVPQLNVNDILTASFCPTDGYADPYSVVRGLGASSRSLGVKIHEETPVTQIMVKKDQIAGVDTTDGKFYAPIVVNAAGPWAKEIGNMVGIDIPVAPHKRHIFVTAPINEMRKDLPMVVELKNGFWFRREGRSLIFGMRNSNEVESYDTTIDWDFLANNLAAVASHRLPLLIDIGISRAQAGLHDDTPDSNGIVGQVPEIKGFYLSCGFSGHGFMHSPAIGSAIAELILRGNSTLDLSSLAPDRFKTQVSNNESCFI